MESTDGFTETEVSDDGSTITVTTTETTTDTSYPEEPVAVDYDEDGDTDGYLGYLEDGTSWLLLDTDGDGNADYYDFDGNGDGVADFFVQRTDDGYTISGDTNFDGVDDGTVTLTVEELATDYPDFYAYILELGLAGDQPIVDTTTTTDDTDYPTVVDGQIVGDPDAASGYWFEQAWNGSCVPSSIAIIASVYSGTSYTDLDLIDTVNAVGGWAVGPDGVPGMYATGAVAVLESVGIPAELAYGDLDLLLSKLEAGDGVIVSVDADEIWYAVDDDSSSTDVGSDHMVVVTAIDTENGLVYLSDSGTPDGNMETIPLDQFLDAWDDSNNEMVYCEISAADFQAQATGDDTPTDDTTTTSTDTVYPEVQPTGDTSTDAVTVSDKDTTKDTSDTSADVAATDTTVDATGADIVTAADVTTTTDAPQAVGVPEQLHLQEVALVAAVAAPWVLLPVVLSGVALATNHRRRA